MKYFLEGSDYPQFNRRLLLTLHLPTFASCANCTAHKFNSSPPPATLCYSSQRLLDSQSRPVDLLLPLFACSERQTQALVSTDERRFQPPAPLLSPCQRYELLASCAPSSCNLDDSRALLFTSHRVPRRSDALPVQISSNINTPVSPSIGTSSPQLI